jgi:ribosomal protein S9
MKQILIEIDERSARDLQRVAPAGKRVRAEFIRLALRRAIDIALDRSTESAYRERPLAGEFTSADLVGWDSENKLAKPAAPRKARRRRRASSKKKAA